MLLPEPSLVLTGRFGTIENFVNFPQTIKGMNAIITAAGNGKVPFVSVQDIGQAAYDALFAKKYPNSDLTLIGPTPYSHDEV